MEVILDPDIATALSGKTISTSGRYPTIRIDGKNVRLHAFVIGYPPAGMETDHINRNRFDNRRINLRHITHQANLQNRRSWGKSGHRHIYEMPKRNKPWCVQVRRNGVKVQYGYFATLTEAIKARDLAIA